MGSKSDSCAVSGARERLRRTQRTLPESDVGGLLDSVEKGMDVARSVYLKVGSEPEVYLTP